MTQDNKIIPLKKGKEVETVQVPMLKNFRVENGEVVAEVEKFVEMPAEVIEDDWDL